MNANAAAANHRAWEDVDVFTRIAREAADEESKEWYQLCEGDLDNAWAIIEDAVNRRPSPREKMVLWLRERIEMLREIDEYGEPAGKPR
jgi:hypothetical protein